MYVCLLLILSNKLDLNQETRFTIKVTLSTISLGESVLCKCYINHYFELQSIIKVYSMFESGYIQIIIIALFQTSKHEIDCTGKDSLSQHKAEWSVYCREPPQAMSCNHSIKVTLSTISLGEAVPYKCYINHYFELQSIIKVYDNVWKQLHTNNNNCSIPKEQT